MNQIKTVLLVILLFTSQLFSQTQFQEFIQHLYQLPTVEEKNTAIDSFMTYARSVGIPFIEGEKANFIYRGSGTSVAIAGDFNGWSSTNAKMINMSGTNFFFRTETFELNARLDYKLVVNNSTWILDPENPNRVSGGYAPNSELAMPEYIQPEKTWQYSNEFKVKAVQLSDPCPSLSLICFLHAAHSGSALSLRR